MYTLKLVVYKKKACVYLVGGTKTPIAKFDKNSNTFEIICELNYKMAQLFWDTYGGFYNKGKFYKVETITDTAKLFEKLIKGEN